MEPEKIDFVKGHGTENDFVVFYDPDVAVNLTADAVSEIADRRAGIGADGVIRIARATVLVDRGVVAAADVPAGAEDLWFMDYRNADGSIAEMCGNGVRVFAHVLATKGQLKIGQEERILTRAGVKTVVVHECDERNARVSVGMGEVRVLGLATAMNDGQTFAGLGIDVGNPHLAAVIPGLTPQKLDGLPVDRPFDVDPTMFPAGTNVEIVTPLDEGTVHMRVHERGVGETRSCGTGTVAAAQAALLDANMGEGVVHVRVPGGEVTVDIVDSGATLTGASAIVAEGQWLG